jgi:hypothetical protein
MEAPRLGSRCVSHNYIATPLIQQKLDLFQIDSG